MHTPFGLLDPTAADIQVFYPNTNLAAGVPGASVWNRRPGTSMVYIFGFASGGQGGQGVVGALATAAGGGGGGSSGATGLLIPALMLPAVLYVSVPFGSGSSAQNARVTTVPRSRRYCRHGRRRWGSSNSSADAAWCRWDNYSSCRPGRRGWWDYWRSTCVGATDYRFSPDWGHRWWRAAHYSSCGVSGRGADGIRCVPGATRRARWRQHYHTGWCGFIGRRERSVRSVL
jgi:hypothetical protein